MAQALRLPPRPVTFALRGGEPVPAARLSSFAFKREQRQFAERLALAQCRRQVRHKHGRRRLSGRAMAEAPRDDDGGGGSGSRAQEEEAISAGEYSRRVHQWLWDSYCGYLSWQSGLAALMAGAANAAASAPPPGAYFYSSSSPCYHLLATSAAPEAGSAPARATTAWPPPAVRHGPPAQRPTPPAVTAPAGSSRREPGRPAGESFCQMKKWGAGEKTRQKALDALEMIERMVRR